MTAVFTDLSTAGYHTQGHAEAPWRVLRTAERLRAAGHGLRPPESPPSDEAILRVHSPRHIEAVRRGTYRDADTPHYPGIETIARTSLSGALSAAARAEAGEPAFSLMRPPGHHAGRERVSGFCYFNNIAIAAAGLVGRSPAVPALAGAIGVAGLLPRRVAIVDVDVHHGDGTDEWALGKEGVHFLSLHQAPLYPGTGLESHGNCRNVPLEPGTGEGAYLKALEAGLREALDFKPELLAVSAGFDTYKDDPLAQLKLDAPSYKRIGRLLAETGLKRFAVLEGGYAEALPVLVERFLDGFFA